MTVPLFAIATEAHAIRYFNWLVDNQLDYHMDDNPRGVIFGNHSLTDKDVANLEANHHSAWEAFSYDAERLWDAYFPITNEA